MYDPIGGFARIRELYITYLETAFRIGHAGLSGERLNRSRLSLPVGGLLLKVYKGGGNV